MQDGGRQHQVAARKTKRHALQECGAERVEAVIVAFRKAVAPTELIIQSVIILRFIIKVSLPPLKQGFRRLKHNFFQSPSENSCIPRIQQRWSSHLASLCLSQPSL